MEFILVRFEVSQLREALSAVVKPAGVGLCSGVYNLVSADVAMLCKGLAADVAVVGTLACVPPFVGLEVAKLAEALAAAWFLAEEGLHASVCAGVDVEMSLLVESFVAAGQGTLVSSLWPTSSGRAN